MTPDTQRLDDLVAFARVEIESSDVEPWADILAELHRSGFADVEQAHWLCALYNSYDSLASAMACYRRWPTPSAWFDADDRDDAANYECTSERRNLRGGKVIRRHLSYVEALAGQPQDAWMRQAVDDNADLADNFRSLTDWMRQVWGVGRQSAFEWAEFAGKVVGLPVDAGDAQLWESEGPRRSLQRLYGSDKPSRQWLDDAAHACKQYIEDRGVELSWWDFETIICDFNVMRDGRYYPGRHHADIIEEIECCDEDDQPALRAAYEAFAPPEWASLEAGRNMSLMPVYRDTGVIVTDPWNHDR